MSSERSLTVSNAGGALSLDRFGPVIDLPVPATDFRGPMRAGLIVIAVALGGFGTWAALAPIGSAVVAQGVVSVESKRKLVQHREGGIVRQVLVHEGDTVAPGTVIARLQDSTAAAQMAAIATQRDTKLAEQARLVAELAGATAVAYPPELAARLREPLVAEIVKRETDRFAERKKTLDGQVGILHQRIAQLEAQKDGRQVQEHSKKRQLELLRDEMAGLRKLEAKGFYPRNKLREKERELARMEGDMYSDGAGATQTGKEIAENRLQILQLQQKFRDDVTAELTKVEAEVNELATKLVAAKDAVDRLEVVAPVGGEVQALKVAGPGAVVPPGGEVAEIVPDKDRLVIEAQVNPRDVDKVAVGQPAHLRFSAFSSRTTPVVEGRVDVVSADRITDDHTRQAYYTVRVEVAPDQLSRLPAPLKAGMPAEVMVDGGERTPLQYLLKPLMDSFARGMREV
ncbi:MAG: HlyD family type I secretion periplasmic adaptor subunit [Actinomycetota bacterium]